MAEAVEYSYDDDWDLMRLFRKLRDGWLWIAGLTVLGGIALATYAAMTPPTYRATVVMIPGGAERSGLSSALSSALGSLGGLASLAGVNVGSGNSANTEEALAVLRSRRFTQKFIEQNDLLPKLYPDRWDAESKSWIVPPGKIPTMSQAIRSFNLMRGVSTDRKSGLISLNVNWRNPEQAAEWANKLVDELNAEMRARAIAKTDASLEFLRKELESTTVVDTREAINRLIESQVNQRMISNVTPEYAFKVVDRALVPDRYDIVAPRRAVLLAAGLTLGFTLGCVGVLLFRKDRRTA